jgi:S-adenosylmethionine:tRNA ribosyltransferase-isomerase
MTTSTPTKNRTVVNDAAAPCGSFDFVLPPELKAQSPPEARGMSRDQVRLMVSQLGDDSVAHRRFGDITEYLREGDVLVVNTSGTIRASLDARMPDGSAVELHLSTRLSADQWTVELRGPGANGTTPCFEGVTGQELRLPDGAWAVLDAPYSRGGRTRLWTATLHLPQAASRYLAAHGSPIRYGYVREQWPISYYQTVYETEAGSAEMPSAGRAFTPELITRLVARGVELVPLLLHTGVSSLEQGEAPYPEHYRISDASARCITEARDQRRPVIAVGTTVVRALETVTDAHGVTHGGEGWTDLVVTPERGARAVDGLLTGLHEPRASHLLMLVAIAGCGHLRISYDEALRERYFWHEFGDLHLILPHR